MANTLKIKRGTAATIPNGALAEPLFTSDTYDLYIGKGDGTNQRFQKYIASGTSSQFLKGDGSLDSTTYQTALTFSSPLVNTSGTVTINQSSGSANGYLSSTDWTTFNSKEPAITAGTTSQYYRGDKTFQTLDTAAVPENGAIYFTEPRVRATVLTGLNLSGGGTIAATDSILTAFGKVQNQISALVGGATYQGTWNASTNTPTLASGTGTKGFYYVVSVAGSTNLDGITDWKIGDWAIFNGTTWDKVDNTDAVSSVNGFTGAVNLALDNISDVSAASPTNAQLLRFNGTSSLWEAWTPTYISAAITSLNGLTDATQTFATGTTGTDFNISSATGVHTFNIPSASSANRGLVTTAAQTFAGVKTFSSTPVVPALHLADMTAGTGALYYGTSEKRLTLANYNTDGILMFEVNGGVYAMAINADKSIRMHGYTTNGILKFGNSDGTIGVAVAGDFPTLNQNTTGSAATLTTPRTLTIGATGKTFDGSANVSWSLAEIGAAAALSGTINTIAYWDSATTIASLATATYPSLTELSYVKGVTSAIQTQLNAKAADNAVVKLTGNQTIDGNKTFSAQTYFNADIHIKTGQSVRLYNVADTFSIGLKTVTTVTANRTISFPDATGTVALTSDLSSYLPLTGGTLTGALTISTSSSPSLNISKDASVDNRYIRFTNTQASSKNWDIINRPNANGNELAFYNDTDAIFALRLASTGAATFSSSVTATNLILNVDGAANWTQYLKTTQTGAKRNSIGFFDNGGTNIASILTDNANNNTADFAIHVPNGSPRLYINSSGNVGIGTTSPSAYGHGGTNIITEIQNSGTAANSQAHLILSTGASTNTGAIGSITFALPNSSATIKRAAVIGSDITSNSSSQVYANLNFATSDGSGAATRMTITSGGNVGIGTTDPQSSLHVYSTGATMILQNSSTSAVGNVSRLFYRALLSSGAIGYIGFIDGVLDSTTANTGYLKFHTYNNGNADERMRLTSGGNIELNGGSIKTGAPSGGTAKPWKLGARLSGTVSTSTTNYLEVEVDGTLYYLAFAVPL